MVWIKAQVTIICYQGDKDMIVIAIIVKYWENVRLNRKWPLMKSTSSFDDNISEKLEICIAFYDFFFF